MSKKIKIIVWLVVGISVYVAGSHLFSRKSGDQDTPQETYNTNTPWVVNNLHGVSFETPEAVTKENVPRPSGNDQINAVDVYMLRKSELIAMFIFMDTNLKQYDTRSGLQSSIQNSVNTMGGTGLRLNFSMPGKEPNEIQASGEYTLRDKTILIKGYLHSDNDGQIAILTSMIQKSTTNEKVIQKIMDSRKSVLPG